MPRSFQDVWKAYWVAAQLVQTLKRPKPSRVFTKGSSCHFGNSMICSMTGRMTAPWIDGSSVYVLLWVSALYLRWGQDSGAVTWAWIWLRRAGGYRYLQLVEESRGLGQCSLDSKCVSKRIQLSGLIRFWLIFNVRPLLLGCIHFWLDHPFVAQVSASGSLSSICCSPIGQWSGKALLIGKLLPMPMDIL